MLKNYLKVASRNLVKSKTFSIINITGMTLGMASVFIISIFVWDELKYDEYHLDKERTYRIYNIRESEDGTTNYLPIVPPAFAPTLERDYPQIESTLRILDAYGDVLVGIDDHRFYQQDAIYAEPTIFDMLSLEMIQGNKGEALDQPNQVVVSERFSRAYFANDDALGRSIRINNYEYEVVGVFKDIPMHSHLQAEVVLSLKSLYQHWDSNRRNSWVWQQFFTYIKLKEGQEVAGLEAQLPAFSETYGHPLTKPMGFTYTPYLQRIDDIYLHSSQFEWEIAKRGSIHTVYALSAAAIFILIIVCVNFINLSTARSLNRLKEVGIRKVVGAQKKQIIIQFLGESIWIALLSVILAGLATELLLPYLNEYTGKNVENGLLTQPLSLVIMICFALTVGVLAGIYPAFFASSFHSLSIFGKRSTGRPSSHTGFRKVTVVIQFALSIFLVIGMVIVYEQLSFLRNKELGFEKEHIMIMDLTKSLRNQPERLKSIKTEWTRHSSIESISYCFGLPGQVVAGDHIIDMTGQTHPANHIMLDNDYISALGLEVVAGRAFSERYVSDPLNAFMINETAVRNLGFESPEKAVGQPLSWDLWHAEDSVKRGKIIGVVKDFHFKSLRDQLTTTILQVYPPAYKTMAIKLKGSSTEEAITFLEGAWGRVEPGWPFSYRFLDESFQEMYMAEQQMSRLFSFFAGLAVVVACMGLFGLVYYIAAQKVREIGIRKVLGASILDILYLINRSFVMLILVGLVIAIPASYYLSARWLENFAYSIEVGVLIFILPGLAMILFALLTVSFQSLKAAWTNPVNVLKDN